MRFGVLGTVAVWGGDGEPVRVPEVKVRALLADLLTHEGRVVSADRLIDDLWGEEPPGRPANALQAKVSQLRRALGRDRVVHQAPGYRLRIDAADGDLLDVEEFRALVGRALREDDPRARAGLFGEALGVWRGAAYADFADEEFVRAAAGRLAEERVSAVEERAEALVEAGEFGLVGAELAELVGVHPLRERLRAVQIRALYLAGRQSEALAAYGEVRGRLAEELGVDPGVGLVALYEGILRQDPGLGPGAGILRQGPGSAPGSMSPNPPLPETWAPAPDPGPRWAGASPPAPPIRGLRPRTPAPQSPEGLNLAGARSNFAGTEIARVGFAPLTPLIGRAQALTSVSQLLLSHRLVTLTGPGGVGKTRLAVAVAGESQADAFPDGVHLVEFAGQRGDLAQLVSDSLGLRDDTSAPRAPELALADALRERRALLVLDNCEHVVDAAADLAGLLLHSAPGIRVLATSQEPFGIAGEAVFLVEPLPERDAVRLFAERAGAAAPGFSLDSGNERSVTEIVRRLDGIPLALELAATRVRALGAQELAVRLGDRFRVLTSGRRGAPARQQTLRAVIDWSWELLSAPERIVLRRLAVHRDGCTLYAAEDVCAGDGVERDAVLDLVGRLVERSLVVMVEGAEGPRYRLLESVAAYATERLEEMEDLDGVRARHLLHYLQLAESSAPQLHGSEQQLALRRLDLESANLRAALDEAVRRGASDDAVRLASALSWWWLLRGRLHEARRALAATLAVSPPGSAPHVLHAAFVLLTGDRPEAADVRTDDGRATWLYAYALLNTNGPDAAEQHNTRALGLFTATGDRWGTAAALGLRAALSLARDDLSRIEDDGQRSAAAFRELGDRWGELLSVNPLASLAEIKGDYAEAERRHQEGLDLARELGLQREISARLSGLGRLALLAHDWDRARDLHEQAHRLAVEQGYTFDEVHALMGLALGARRSGRLDDADTHLRHIRDTYASTPVGEHLLHTEFGFIAELRGDAALSASHHLTALATAHSIGEPRALAHSLEGLAGAASLASDARLAARLLGAADAARRSVDAPLPSAERGDVDRITARAQSALGQEEFEAENRHGAELTPDEAGRLARTSLSPESRR
ncbi:AfsR/SARP family transcriptional regulator [Streptomyces sp. NBC_01465]|uniref:AfsR/SARP family transcriptional regulator n=1 Tax=Streptomyces sp. NBC_01465 TaxID=2903878 RepID=UPI002E30A01D|nr:BTAD domain-containing putative transcriptional regulator [Streptomyces sp. NBC_01465]